MNDNNVENWSFVPGNPWMPSLEPSMLLPEGIVKQRSYRGSVVLVHYDRKYVVAKLAHSLRAFRGLKERHWRALVDEVATEIGIDASGE